MHVLDGGVLLVDPDEGTRTTRGNWTSISRIGRATGAKEVSQSIDVYESGRSPAVINPSSEEVLYVVRGKGRCHINGFSYDLGPDTGVFIPRGAEYSIESAEGTPLTIVSALCPEDPDRTIGNQSSRARSGNQRELTVHVRDREKLPATAGREFCLMVDKDLGCEQVTQFVGWIPPSAAPFHHHEYEEVIYILDGKGILHAGEESRPFEAGSSIYLPVRVPHCLENPGPLAMRVLGVFYPSGSPAAAYRQ
jgi:mannose-6-phosphate isomerase-like protein (cupin superfamily)